MELGNLTAKHAAKAKAKAKANANAQARAFAASRENRSESHTQPDWAHRGLDCQKAPSLKQ